MAALRNFNDLASWGNVDNSLQSVNLTIPLGDFNVKPDWSRLCDWLKRCRPDIVTLQKIGSTEPFPTEALRNIDYESWFLHHCRYYRGVAILAHRDFLRRRDAPSPKVRDCELPGDDRSESRFLTVSIGDLSVSSVYAPLPRPTITPTVDWLNLLRDHVEKRAYSCQDSILCGDFNVTFVDTSKGKLNRALEELKNLGFVDLYRKAYRSPKEKPGRTRGYSEKCPNGTSRLHLILASKSMKERLQSACVDVKSRHWPREDAPPLVVDLDDI